MNGIESSRVLIVEDDEAIAALVRRTLADAGIETDVTHDGLDGLWMAREHPYGAVCLDILLPGMNGYEVCRTLRAEDNSVPILMLTAKGGEYDEIDGLDLGADDYLRKPFSPGILVARVRSLLRRRIDGRESTVLTRGELDFNTTSRECRVAGEVVPLTPREATLLETLLRADDTPVSRANVLREVWGPDFDGDPNVIDVYIGYLRRKLGRDRIETVRGVGFRVAA